MRRHDKAFVFRSYTSFVYNVSLYFAIQVTSNKYQLRTMHFISKSAKTVVLGATVDCCTA